jgi:hypothetical protein
MDQLRNGYVPPEHEPWQPIEIWLYQITEWMSNRQPSVENCQQHLQPQEALLQPFFDPVQKGYERSRRHGTMYDKRQCHIVPINLRQCAHTS